MVYHIHNICQAMYCQMTIVIGQWISEFFSHPSGVLRKSSLMQDILLKIVSMISVLNCAEMLYSREAEFVLFHFPTGYITHKGSQRHYLVTLPKSFDDLWCVLVLFLRDRSSSAFFPPQCGLLGAHVIKVGRMCFHHVSSCDSIFVALLNDFCTVCI